MTQLHICRGPALEEIHREFVGERWCFICRKRVEFLYIVTAPVEPSYYDPNPSIRCASGHTDGDIGFGGCREWNW